VFCKLCTIFNFFQRGIAKQGENPVQLQTREPLAASAIKKSQKQKLRLDNDILIRWIENIGSLIEN